MCSWHGARAEARSRARTIVRAALVLAALVGTAPAIRAQDSVTTELSLQLNLAARRLDLVRDGDRVASYRVAIGQPEFPTPTGEFLISAAEWNPWWVPPAREWTKGREPMPPGPTNPMGRAKLWFRTFYFLHGTPDSGSIGQAASHGCVRLSNADVIALATLLIREAVPDFEPGRLEAMAADQIATVAVPFQRRVPLEIVYHVVEPVGDSVRFHPNPYRWTTDRIIADLTETFAGAILTRGPLDLARVRTLISAALERTRTVPWSELTNRSAGSTAEWSRTSLP